MQALRRGEAVLRSFAMQDVAPALIARWHAALPAEEQVRADRFRFAPDRAAYVAAHALLRALLADYGVREARFATNPWGRPHLLPDAGRLGFSLTHTRARVAVALAADDGIGIDAETVDERLDATGLAARFFAPSEAAWLRALPPGAIPAAFCRIWTLKEAFVKAIGKGLSVPLDSFAFDWDGGFACTPALGDPTGWCFSSRETAEGFLSVALRWPSAARMIVDDETLTPDALDEAVAHHLLAGGIAR